MKGYPGKWSAEDLGYIDRCTSTRMCEQTRLDTMVKIGELDYAW
jgi:hypothetical protein